MYRNKDRVCLWVILAALSITSACKSLHQIPSNGVHGGIKYTLHEDTRFSRVEKGKNGSLMYDSPELTVQCENGKLRINGQDAGTVKAGDHVEVTDTQMVLVNGEHRGDVTTGAAQNRQRLQQSKMEVMAH